MTLADSSASSLAAELRQHHQDLARRCLSQPISAEERQGFINELTASGKALPPGRDRDAVRKLLYYWTADAVSRGERSREQPLPSLEPFSGIEADAASAVSRVLTTAQSSEDIEAATADTRAAIRIATLARQWMADNRSAGYLLTGAALQEAARLADNDPDIRTLVDASTVAEAVRAAAEAERTAAELYKAKRAKLVFIGFIGGLILVLLLGLMGVRLWYVSDQLEKIVGAMADQAAVEQQNREEARSIVDALRSGRSDPLPPLKKLLRRLSYAQPEDLERLQVKPLDGPTAYGDDKIDRDPQTPIVRAQQTDQAKCRGAMWLGSDEAKLIDYHGKLQDLKAGDPVTVIDGANVRLREKMPSAEYVMTRQIGLVPGGAVLKLTGAPEKYTRPGVDQYFAPVEGPRQYCVRVFVQYVGDDDQADELRKQLRPLGVQVPPAQEIKKAPAEPEVRVFLKDDRGVADQVAEQLKAFNGAKKLAVVELYNFPSKPAPGNIEVWITLKK
jgi:hypothetical protein